MSPSALGFGPSGSYPLVKMWNIIDKYYFYRPGVFITQSFNTRVFLLQVYEEYLQKLLSKPALRGSDLLFSFLACPGEFVAEDSSLGRLLSRGFPITLRKERGQHLEPFINTFFASTESRVRHRSVSNRWQQQIFLSKLYIEFMN